MYKLFNETAKKKKPLIRWGWSKDVCVSSTKKIKEFIKYRYVYKILHETFTYALDSFKQIMIDLNISVLSVNLKCLIDMYNLVHRILHICFSQYSSPYITFLILWKHMLQNKFVFHILWFTLKWSWPSSTEVYTVSILLTFVIIKQ